ncbi:YedE family putative selenium transporter [Anaeromyxobacter dehalogenans]|uniref:Sulphur transport domain-containing protein n=1 Tax=Anaeromyxobacter dehalogenans (strain 2CP-C) TaxID=290397 RepID=Q2IKA4_ANADE|nr:YedE family putative selenium transporter [Anaeromyxobacter dehalogenans]ABC82083.1 conserved hypothetical protein [Anaeromyxobacter dehalogenans 2CP-C]
MQAQSPSSALWKLLLAGLFFGVVASLLVYAGNPGNMGVCVACFLRDITGAFGGSAAGMGALAYLRPELPALVLGAAGAAVASGQFRPRGGVAVLPRFVLGFVFMVAALVFLGCTVRVWLRVGGGDLNAVVGAVGLVAGIAVGAAVLRSGYALPASREVSLPAALAVPGIAIVLLAIALLTGGAPAFLTVAPAVKRAPIAISLVAGLALGVVAQRSRLCTTGGIRDVILWRRPEKLLGIAGLVAGALAANAVLGQLRFGFEGQPIAHTDALTNFASTAVAGLAAVLMGGCPLRQLVMAGEGDAGAGGALAGMVAGALFAHGARLASSPKGPASGALPLLAVLAAVTLALAWYLRRQQATSAAAAPDA